MQRSLSALAVVLGFMLAVSCPIQAQQSEDLKPGQTFPKEGYFPDAKKVVYVVFWHHKKRVDEFGFQDFFMTADGVNDTTARKIKEAMEKRYPNLTVYVKETNERDVRDVVERERKRIKFVEKDWVDVKQPEKVELPKRQLVDREWKVTYDDDAPKVEGAYTKPSVVAPIAKFDLKGLDGTWRRITDTKAGFQFLDDGTVRFLYEGSIKPNVKITWSRNGDTVVVTGPNWRFEGRINGPLIVPTDNKGQEWIKNR